MAGMPVELRAQVAVIYSPLMAIVGVNDPPELTTVDAAIFTSSNGVTYGPRGMGRVAYCVGAATTAAARQRGWVAREMGDDAEGLVSQLISTPPDQPLVHLRGQHTRGDVVARLRKERHVARDAIVYDQVLQPLTKAAKNVIAREPVVVAPLLSPRTAAQFAKEVPRTTSLRVIAISESVASAAQPHEVAAVATRPNARSMYDAVAHVISSG